MTGKQDNIDEPAVRPFPHSICWRCQHVRRIESGKGSVFLMCGYAVENRVGAKYPPQPVRQCSQFVAATKATD